MCVSKTDNKKNFLNSLILSAIKKFLTGKFFKNNSHYFCQLY